MIKPIAHFITTHLKGYRTMLVNGLMLIMPVLEMSEILDVLPQHYHSHYLIMMALVNIYLRSITTTPLGRSQ